MQNYKIESSGKVFSKVLKKELSPYSNGLGYQAIKLIVDGKRKQFYVHRLVAQQFIGETEGKVVNHIDSNKSNNDVSNLEIVTQKENQQHAFRNKLLKGFVEKYY